jgi:hypothetical protein
MVLLTWLRLLRTSHAELNDNVAFVSATPRTFAVVWLMQAYLPLVCGTDTCLGGVCIVLDFASRLRSQDDSLIGSFPTSAGTTTDCQFASFIMHSSSSSIGTSGSGSSIVTIGSAVSATLFVFIPGGDHADPRSFALNDKDEDATRLRLDAAPYSLPAILRLNCSGLQASPSLSTMILQD